MKTGGTAIFTDLDSFVSWYAALSLEEAKAVHEKLSPLTREKNSCTVTPAKSSLDSMFLVSAWCSYPPSETREAKWPIQRLVMADKIKDFVGISKEYSIPLHVGKWEEGKFAFLYMGNSEKGIIVPKPEKYLEYIPEKDYSGYTPAQLREELCAPRSAQQSQILPAELEGTMTVKKMAEKQETAQQQIQDVNQAMDDVKNARTGELAELQAEIDKLQAKMEAKKAALMAQLEDKMNELENTKENLENQIFLLDSQIYAIRCFAGETVTFTQLRSGQKAPATTPVVIHQKLRFLDEDLGRLASLYEIQWEHINKFEDFLRHSPAALETFAPNERCVMLVRLSKDGKSFGMTQFPYSNMLERYEYYHGTTVGIIIRNGENLYLGWTDKERVHIKDDLIVRVTTTATEPIQEREYISDWERKQEIKHQKTDRKLVMDGIVSRAFVYNVLQGIVEHTDILPLPENVDLSKESSYVRYAIADQWITDSRFGSFNDIIRHGNERITKGDMVLTTQCLRPELSNRYDNNPRGRGYANRTHDVSAKDCTIYPINLIERDEPVPMTRYKYKDCTYFIKTRDAGTLSPECVILEEYTIQDSHVFISLEKEWSGSYYGNRSKARANFELYDGEYINLTYLNSVWLEWVITNKALGNWTVGGKPVNYAYAIRYLKTALDFIRKREVKERNLLDSIDPAVCQVNDWQVTLSEWKLENKVRQMTEFQARRFAKNMLENQSGKAIEGAGGKGV